jgi:hypothetical protein
MSARLWFSSALCLLFIPLGGEIRSDNTISNPLDGQEYFDYAAIDANGTRIMGATVKVKLEKGVTVGGEKTFIGPEQAVDWQKEFAAPDGHWTPTGGWECVLYNVNDAEQDTHDYTIKVPPPGGG